MRLARFGGMSNVITLRDKGFIIIDGGQALMHYKEHSEVLYDYLKARSNSDKPVILGWFFTHFHSDHIACAANFLIDHRDDIIVKGFYINDPGAVIQCRDLEMEELLQKAMEAHPEAIRHTLKTREKIEFPYCYVDILHTESDEPESEHSSLNTISAAFMVVFDNGRSFTVLGDCSLRSLTRFIDENDPLYRSKSELKSDVLQVPHHGRPLGTVEDSVKNAEYYKTVSPSVCFFPIHRESFEKDEFYTEEKWADNYYLLHSGAKCYHHSDTVTVDMDDLSIVIEEYKSNNE